MEESILPGAIAGFPQEMGVRELGGLRGAGGRPLRRGLFYRGSALVGLSEQQKQIVDSFGLMSILDLRSAAEAEDRADYVPRGTKYLRIGGMYGQDGEEIDFSPAGIADMVERAERENGSELEMERAFEGFMRDLYVSMMFGNPAVHEMVRMMTDEQVPLYLHCTAGKDRTGVCAAVVLMLLGVSDDDIVREFLLTNEYRAPLINMGPDDLPQGISEHDRKNWAKMHSVRESDLRSAFAAVDERYESRASYFVNEFGLDDVAIARLRDRYLVSSDMPALPMPEVNQLLDTPYVKVYDLAYEDDTHYFEASRRSMEDLRVLKDEREHAKLLSDAVSCCLVLAPSNEEPRLVLFYEYRYPIGQYVLSIPSGLVDEPDRQRRDPLVAAMVREIYEETGIAFGAKDSIRMINPLLFNSPGLTDESTALLCAIIRGTDSACLSQAGASGSERFGGFELVTQREAVGILKRGRDKFGHFYPMVTWTALVYFATGIWKQ